MAKEATARQSPEKEAMRVGVQRQYAAGVRPPRGHLESTAAQLGVSVRTLNNWKRQAERGEAPRKRGRKPRSPEVDALCEPLIEQVLALSGAHVGEGTVEAVLDALDARLSTRAIRAALAKLKAARRALIRADEAARRTSLVVKRRDAVWAQDATELERIHGKKVTTEVVRDVATANVGGLEAALKDPNGESALRALEATINARGQAPLMVCVDRGAAYRSRTYQNRLKELKIICLHNVPHTPKHNAFAERAVREIKDAAAGLDDVTHSATPKDAQRRWQQALELARSRLARRPRASRNGLNSLELDRALPEVYDRIDRDAFYAAAIKAQAAARRIEGTYRQRLMAVRKATLDTAVNFGLVTVLRGGVPIARGNSENNS